jgi:predicted signal transduction protein with EAL and GGDEF domain
MDSPHLAAEVLSQLRDFGVKVYLDDFGTGYSSLSHLHKLPVDALKIDRSFVTSLLLPERPAIVESILALARTMQTSVVAEGIESDVQAHELERLGCTHAQGYLFSRPLSAQAAEELIIANRPLGPKRVPDDVAADDADAYSSKPFEWPVHVPGGNARSGTQPCAPVVAAHTPAQSAFTAT